MITDSEAAIRAGYEGYDLEACSKDPFSTELARRLEEGRKHLDSHTPLHRLDMPDWAKKLTKDWVWNLWEDMTQRLEMIDCPHEPYKRVEEMRADVAKGRMFYRLRHTGAVVGDLTSQWRAVHDYYGHVLGLGAFNLSGELAAYIAHTNGPAAFPRACHPFIWNNVVLENAFRTNRGHFYCEIKQCPSAFIYDGLQFGPRNDWYRRATA